MRKARVVQLCVVFMSVVTATMAQDTRRLESSLGAWTLEKSDTPVFASETFQKHVANGKLILSLDDAIRLALANNTDIRIDQSAVETARNNVYRQHQSFDPSFTSLTSSQRSKSPAYQGLQGASVLNILSQSTQVGYAQTLETGTNIQSIFSVNKYSTNDSFYFLNPYLASNWQFQFTQPILRNFGSFANRAPIVIAQRGLRRAQASFQAEVEGVVLQLIVQYWNVVLARANLSVQKESYEQARQSYEHDKQAISVGILPAVNIYRSESVLASRLVNVIHTEYALKQAEDLFRQVIGADHDPNIRALDVDLTETSEPHEPLISADIATALSTALANRSEIEAARQQLAGDDTSVRLAHNKLRPDLSVNGQYSTNGLAGNQFSLSTPPMLISTEGLSNSLSQLFHFKYPTYGLTLSLTLPIKNHGARADLGDALVNRRRDEYQQEKTRESITLEVANAVHQLEEAKLSLEAAKVAVDLARKSLQAEQRKSTLGSSTVFFVLDAQTQLAQAEYNLAQAQTSYHSGAAYLDYATGELLERHGVEITSGQK